MGIFFVYILKSSVCLALFYLFYRLLLSKETFHRFNRIALLGLLTLSCVVPFLEVTVGEASEVGQAFVLLEDMLVSAQESQGVLEEASSRFSWEALMLLVYVGGILFFMGRHLWSLGRMIHLLFASRKEKLEGSVTLFVHRKEVAPFSWMKMIAVSEADLAENRDVILTHERAHIHNRHSWDLLLAEVCVFFQWFNPAAWLLKQELQNIHEYEADEWVIENGIDAKTYQLLIIKKAVGARLYSIANSFNHSSLKKRITMMIKKKSNPWARMKYLYVLPLAAVAVAAFARPEVSNKLDEISSVKVNDLTSIVETIGLENEDSVSKNQWFPAVPVTETDTVARLPIKLEVGKKPLFVIDGKPFGTYLSLDDIDASMVESATLLDKTEAMKLYGEKAKDGALVITSKHPERTKVHRGVQFNVPSTSDKKFKVSGTVLAAETKVPVMGASVIIRGTTNGTLTDLDGKFTLTGLKKDDVIQVSFVGFQTRSVIVKDESPLTIMLDDAIQNLDEMTVVGYASNGVGAPSSDSDKKVVAVVDIPKVKETPQEKVIFQVVEEMPEFPGGMAEAMKFLGKNIKYPVAAQQAKIEGRVIVQFVVEKDGSVSDVKVMRGVNPELDAEAIRVVSMMPKWIPGKQRGKAVAVKYTMPIMFRLQTPEPKKEEASQTLHFGQAINLKVDKDATREDVDMVKNHLRSRFTGVPVVMADDGKKPLIIVDGEVKEGMKLSQISPETIESISVMKNEAAISQYGDKAKDGVISIATKKNKK